MKFKSKINHSVDCVFLNYGLLIQTLNGTVEDYGNMYMNAGEFFDKIFKNHISVFSMNLWDIRQTTEQLNNFNFKKGSGIIVLHVRIMQSVWFLSV